MTTKKAKHIREEAPKWFILSICAFLILAIFDETAFRLVVVSAIFYKLFID